MFNFLNRNARNHYSVKLWVFRCVAILAYLFVSVASIIQYSVIDSTIDNIEETNGEGVTSDDAVTNDEVLPLMLRVTVIVRLLNLLVHSLSIRKYMIPATTSSRLRDYNLEVKDPRLTPFKEALEEAIKEQGGNCLYDRLFVRRDARPDVYLSVELTRGGCLNGFFDRHVILYVSDLAKSELNAAISPRSFFQQASPRYNMHHEARHVVAGHICGYQTVDAFINAANTVCSANLIFFAFICLLSLLLNEQALSGTIALELFQGPLMGGVVLLTLLKAGGITARAKIAREHDADRVGIQYAMSKPLDAPSFLKRFWKRNSLNSTTYVSATCCCFFSPQYAYMYLDEAEGAIDYERCLTGSESVRSAGAGSSASLLKNQTIYGATSRESSDPELGVGSGAFVSSAAR